MLGPNPSEAMCLKMNSDKLTAKDKQNWQNQLFDDRNGIEMVTKSIPIGHTK